MANSRLRFGIGMAVLCMSGPALAGDVVFDISYVDEIQQTAPKVATYNVNQHVVVTLHDGNRVSEQRNWTSPGDHASIGVSGALGETVPAGKFSVRWKVENENSLIRYREFPQHIETLRIRVSGKSCEASITHALKSGFKEYERFGSRWQPVYYSTLRSTGIVCRAQEG